MIKEIVAFAGSYRLKNLKSCNGSDGLAWSATLYKDGRKLGEVRDGGHGGPVEFNLSASDLNALTAYSVTKVDPSFEPEGSFVAALADYTESIKRIKRMGSKSVVAIIEGDTDDYGVPQRVSQFRCAPTPANLAAIKAKYPGYRLLADEIALW
ncbi:hypothetical protein [Castellaniella sp.]|uniref:hypothetical protein n=1 Tax=Castellaniella sp. TaxID=1955812 RepID=UPI002AFECA0A|nr:hypothetical protein [Castellaniella sp.]